MYKLVIFHDVGCGQRKDAFYDLKATLLHEALLEARKQFDGADNSGTYVISAILITNYCELPVNAWREENVVLENQEIERDERRELARLRAKYGG